MFSSLLPLTVTGSATKPAPACGRTRLAVVAVVASDERDVHHPNIATNGTLTAEQALSALSTGVVKVTTTTGVLSTAAQGTDYYAPGGTDVAVVDGAHAAETATAAHLSATPTARQAQFVRIVADDMRRPRERTTARSNIGLGNARYVRDVLRDELGTNTGDQTLSDANDFQQRTSRRTTSRRRSMVSHRSRRRTRRSS